MIKLLNQYTKRLNLNICPQTYETIERVATIEGRKTGNMARKILDVWAMDEQQMRMDEKKTS